MSWTNELGEPVVAPETVWYERGQAAGDGWPEDDEWFEEYDED